MTYTKLFACAAAAVVSVVAAPPSIAFASVSLAGAYVFSEPETVDPHSSTPPSYSLSSPDVPYVSELETHTPSDAPSKRVQTSQSEIEETAATSSSPSSVDEWYDYSQYYNSDFVTPPVTDADSSVDDHFESAVVEPYAGEEVFEAGADVADVALSTEGDFDLASSDDELFYSQKSQPQFLIVTL